MAKLTGNMIKAGLRVWTRTIRNCKFVPVELVVVDGVVHERGEYFHVANPRFSPLYTTSDHGPEHLLCIYASDLGVRPYNYDNRPTQVFTTREELEEAMAAWGDENPNFLEGE